ncbi:MAG TPA: hypothetical protein VMB46_09720 [Methanomassiliicoccales archaeon]|nr:hypothetical protein [Methanomassiliicoccales archaeon]
MLPDHCKDVSVREVDFELTKENIDRHTTGKKAYTRTEYIVLRHGKEHAVVRVFKEGGTELFRPISAHKIVSLPTDTVFIKDENVDVLSRAQMVKVALAHPGKTVVVQGLFNHVSFASGREAIELRVLDVVPPAPSKLSVLVGKALDVGLVDLPVVPINEEIDLNRLELQVKTRTVMFPCRASGITTEKNVLFLDETPRLKEEVTLVGCDLSRRIFHSLYKQKPIHVNMCPRDLAPKDGRYRIVKCCRVREGFEIEGTTATVPWGATVREVADAISALLRNAVPG